MDHSKHDSAGGDVLAECGSCGSYHRADYRGDCRNDAERFGDPQEYTARTGRRVAGTVEYDDATGGYGFSPEPGTPYTRD